MGVEVWKKQFLSSRSREGRIVPSLDSTTVKPSINPPFLDRFKPEMWTPLATELGIPWRAAEAMHWQLGEQDMARRAGVVPFSSITPSNASAAGTMSSTSSISGASSLGTAGEGSGGRGRRGRETGRRRESLPSGNVRVRREQQGLLPSLAEMESGVPAYVGPFGRGDDEEREGRGEGG